MTGLDAPRSPRLAAVLLLLGVAILVVSLGLIAYGDRDLRAADPMDMARSAGRGGPTAGAQLVWVRWLFWLAILLFALVIVLSAFLRWSRHFRHDLLRRPDPPTPYVDAWAMHRPPPAENEPQDG